MTLQQFTDGSFHMVTEAHRSYFVVTLELVQLTLCFTQSIKSCPVFCISSRDDYYNKHHPENTLVNDTAPPHTHSTHTNTRTRVTTRGGCGCTLDSCYKSCLQRMYSDQPSALKYTQCFLQNYLKKNP